MTPGPPKDLLEILATLDYERAIDPDDPRWVNTEAGRGSERTGDRVARKFGLRLSDGGFFPPTKRHVLFFGHTGSGKTTELRRYQALLSGPERFFVVEVGIADDLDQNNFEYTDVLMGLGRSLFARLLEAKVPVDPDSLKGLEDWFRERILTSDVTDQFTAGIDTEAKVGFGIAGILKLFTRFTAAFKSNVTYKDELRTVVRNTYTQFADEFNAFLRSAEAAISGEGKGKRIVFFIDGTDKLRGGDTRRFFVEDAAQLDAIDALVLYAAPLSMKYQGNLPGTLDADLVLPMIKLYEKDGSPFRAGHDAVRGILLRRADRSVFTSEDEIERLVECSGGHPRELLRLLKLCCEYSETDEVDASTVTRAIAALASDYRRFLQPEDYRRLAKIDVDPLHTGNDEQIRRLLFDLALLEYNDGGWQRSHPVVRGLDGYREAAEALGGTGDG